MRIVAIDPGKEKCGAAVVENRNSILDRKIVFSSRIGDLLQEWLIQWKPNLVLLGNGTFSNQVRESVRPLLKKIPMRTVDEHDTTYRARRLYFQHHPPKGIWRLIPRSLQVPPRPYDDFAAALLAFRYLENKKDD